MSRLVKTLVLTTTVLVALSFSVSANTIVTIGKPNTGISVGDNKEISNIVKGCLISAGLDDVSVNTSTDIDEIVKQYDTITKLNTTPEQLQLAKEELNLAKDIINNNRTNAEQVAKLLAKCKVCVLNKDILTNDDIQHIATKLDIRLDTTQLNSLDRILSEFIKQHYNKSNILIDLKSQYSTSHNIFISVLKQIFK